MPRWIVLLVAGALACSSTARAPDRRTAKAPPADPETGAEVIAPAAPACNVTVRAAPWSMRGKPPMGAAGIVAWSGNQLVEIERDAKSSVVAHEFDATKQTWRAAPLPGAAPVMTLDSQELTATEHAVVYTPGNALDDAPSIGGVFDPSTGTWRKPAKRLPLRDWTAQYSKVSGGRWVLYTREFGSSASPMHRVLFDPLTLDVIELPAPPVADPRYGAVVALDDDNVVIWGGHQRDDRYTPTKLLDDGAVFRIKARRWEPIPKGPSARSEPVFDLHDRKLMIFGGVDALRSAANHSLPEEMVDDLVTGAYVLDLVALRWQPVAFDWAGWARGWAPFKQPGDPTGNVTACWRCVPQLALRSGSFFATGLFYDAKAQAIQRIAPVRWPRSWVVEPLARALDDRHMIMIVWGSPEALVLDLGTRSWCSATLPADAVAFTEYEAGDQIDTTAHGGGLYIWRSAAHHENDSDGTIHDTPAKGLIVTFTWP